MQQRTLWIGVAVLLLVAVAATFVTIQAPSETSPETATITDDVALAPGGTDDLAPEEAIITPDLLALLPEAEVVAGPLQPELPEVTNGFVVIDAISNTDGTALLTELEAIGLINGSSFNHMVSGLLPVESIPQLNNLTYLRVVRSAQATSGVGSVTTQGDEAQRSDEARAQFNVDGSGQKVGILSDSFNALGGYNTDIGTGDLPAGINILADLSGFSDEGRGMAQLVYDVAPGADINFHTAFGGPADYANGILELAADGSTVIVDDVIYFTEPFYADGIIAQAVDAVDAQGIPYVSMMFNDTDNAYEAPNGFVNSGQTFQGAALHDFDPGAGVDTRQSFTIRGNSTVRLSFQWANPYASTSQNSPGANADLDFLIFFNGAFQPSLSSQSNNIGGDPIEFISLTNNGNTDIIIDIAIALNSGNAPEAMKYVFFSNGAQAGVVNEYATPGKATGIGHHNASGTMGVGAAFFGQTPEFGVNPPLLESFSGFGGQPIYFDINGQPLSQPDFRDNPDFVAPDGGNTTFFGSDIGADADSFPNFFGTSAAAPHAAAVVALMLELNPNLSPADIESALETTAIDIVGISDGRTLPVGYDRGSGHGLIDAVAALAAVEPDPCATFTFPASVTTYDEMAFAIDCYNQITTPGVYTINVTADILVADLTPVDTTSFFINNPTDGVELVIDGDSDNDMVNSVFESNSIQVLNLFKVSANTDVTFDSLTITKFHFVGYASILDNRGTATMIDTVITDNDGSDGDLFYNQGPLNIINSTISDNTWTGAAFAGMFYNFNTINITNSTFAKNQQTDSALGADTHMFRNEGDIYVTGTTFVDHIGGIFDNLNSLTVVNSTFAGNATNDVERASAISNSFNLVIVNSTFASNYGLDAASLSITDVGGSAIIANSIFANSIGGPECGFIFGDNTQFVGTNIVEDGSCDTANNPNVLNVDPLLGDLTDKGGLTDTMALLQGSPAINVGDNSLLDENSLGVDLNGDGDTDDMIETDQRGAGFARVIGSNVDLGAFESDVDNIAPVAIDDEFSTDEDVALSDSVATNDSDVDEDELTFSLDTDVANGTLAFNADGSFTYTPNADFYGEDTFTYTVSDGELTDEATVTITVNPVNDAPVAVDDQTEVDEDSSVVIPVLDNDADVEDDALSIVGVTDPSNGDIVVNGDGTISYYPDPDFFGEDAFTYTISDGELEDTATVAITVNDVVDPTPTDPTPTEPTPTEPTPTEPTPTEPTPTEPTPTEPTPTEPTPTEPTPTEPTPTEPTPTEPTPTEPTPTEPTPTEPTPTEPTPTEPTPTEPTPTEPTPTEPTPTEPTPTEPTPTEPTPTEPTPTEPTPTEPTPTEPTPTEPTPTEPTPTEPSLDVNPVEVCWVQDRNNAESVWKITNDNIVPVTPGTQQKVLFDWAVYESDDATGEALQSGRRYDQRGDFQLNTRLANSIKVLWYVWDNGEILTQVEMVIAVADQTGSCDNDYTEPIEEPVVTEEPMVTEEPIVSNICEQYVGIYTAGNTTSTTGLDSLFYTLEFDGNTVVLSELLDLGAYQLQGAHVAINETGLLFILEAHGQQRLFSYDLGTQMLNTIGFLGVPELTATAFGPNGVLYAASSVTDEIYTINTTTAATTAIFDLGANGVNVRGGDLVVKPDGTILIGNRDVNSYYEINLSNNTVTLIPSNGRTHGLLLLDNGTGNLLSANAGVNRFVERRVNDLSFVTEYIPVDVNQVEIDLDIGDAASCVEAVVTPPSPATITVIKTVINDDDGTASVSDFPLFIDQTSVTSGVGIEVLPGIYRISESIPDGLNYVGTIGGACDANGVVTVAAGDNVTCTITNDDVREPTPTPPTPNPTNDVCWKQDNNNAETQWRVTNDHPIPYRPGTQQKVRFDWVAYDVDGNVVQEQQGWDQNPMAMFTTPLAYRIEVRFYVWDNGVVVEELGTYEAFTTEEYRCDREPTPTPTEPTPTEPTPTEPTPTEPTPTEPTPTEPTPTEPTPTEPTPTETPTEVPDDDGDGVPNDRDACPNTPSGVEVYDNGCAIPVGSGDVQVTLTWTTYADMDLHVIDPSGERIYYGNRSSASGGTLDVDAYPACSNNVSPNPTAVENIFWPEDNAPEGTYQVFVDEFTLCDAGAAEWTLTVLVGGTVVLQETGIGNSITYTFDNGEASSVMTGNAGATGGLATK